VKMSRTKSVISPITNAFVTKLVVVALLRASMYPRCGRLYVFSGCCQFIGVNIRESLQQRTIADAFDNCFKRWTDRQTDRGHHQP